MMKAQMDTAMSCATYEASGTNIIAGEFLMTFVPSETRAVVRLICLEAMQMKMRASSSSTPVTIAIHL